MQTARCSCRFRPRPCWCRQISATRACAAPSLRRITDFRMIGWQAAISLTFTPKTARQNCRLISAAAAFRPRSDFSVCVINRQANDTGLKAMLILQADKTVYRRSIYRIDAPARLAHEHKLKISFDAARACED